VLGYGFCWGVYTPWQNPYFEAKGNNLVKLGWLFLNGK